MRHLTEVQLGVRALRAAYAGGLSPHVVVDAVSARIAARGDDAVWISRVTLAELYARASELESLDPVDLPLFGVPFAVKDNIDVAGLPTTAACPAFAYTPAVDAGSVRRLLDAGAIVIGKTNLDQFATGLTGVRSPYGACGSVFGGDLVSGGSSSGSAVAVAAGLVGFSLGTDTAGSGRVPAAMNGIVGVKPTRGLVGASGVVPACRSLDCVSIFAPDLDDAADVLAVLAGPDPADPWSRPPPTPSTPFRAASSPFRAASSPNLCSEFADRRPDVAEPRVESANSGRGTANSAGTGAVRLALAAPGELDFEGDGPLAAVFAGVAEGAAARAAGVVHTAVGPLVEAGNLLYGGPWVAERLAGLAGFLAEHPDDVLPVIRVVVGKGAGYSAVDAFRSRHRLQELRAWCDRLWERADVLLLPTVPTTFTRAQIAREPVTRNLVLGRWTQFANLLDLAAVAVPAGATPDGRPVGSGERGEAVPGGRRATRPGHSDRRAARRGGLPPHGSAAASPAAGAGGPFRAAGTHGAPRYRLVTLPGPGVRRGGIVADGGTAVEVELHRIPTAALGVLLCALPAPLAIGPVELADGRVLGMVCVGCPSDAVDVSAYDSWPAYLRSVTV